MLQPRLRWTEQRRQARFTRDARIVWGRSSPAPPLAVHTRPQRHVGRCILRGGWIHGSGGNSVIEGRRHMTIEINDLHAPTNSRQLQIVS